VRFWTVPTAMRAIHGLALVRSRHFRATDIPPPLLPVREAAQGAGSGQVGHRFGSARAGGLASRLGRRSCFALGCLVTLAITADSVAQSLTITPGREFAADSYVHKPLPRDTPVDPKSQAYVAGILRQIKAHYGHADVNIDGGTPHIYIVPADQPTVRVKYVNWEQRSATFPPLQAQWMAVPLPDGFQPSRGSDKEAVVYQPSTGRMWEFWAMQKTGLRATDSAGRAVDEWGAKWGGRMDDIAHNPGYWKTVQPQGHKFGTTASGIPFLAGILTVEELRRGEINHVVGFAIPQSARKSWSHPAQRSDGTSDDPDAIPQGTIFRLPADLNLDVIEMDPFARMIARAVQRHGMILWDTSGVVGFRAENPGDRYPDGHPFWKGGGILSCPPGADVPGHQAVYRCWPPGRLASFPWEKLIALQPQKDRP
jgi:hypothetical protein